MVESKTEQNRIKNQESLVTIACVQFEPRIGEKERNLAKTINLIHEASGKGAKLIVLPELCNSGYVFNTREEAYLLSEPIPGGDSVTTWERSAKELGVYIVAGICERDGAKLYNSAVLIGPQGYIGKFRKAHLWYEENLFFEPGNLGFPVFQTPIGRISMLICYDIWFPEAHRLCAIQNADIICVCTNWVPMPEQKREELPMAIHLCMANAHVNGVFIAAADRIGEERGQPFLGNSVIVGPKGWIKTGPASMDGEEIILAECNLSEARRVKALNELNHVLNDRRKDTYGSVVS